MKLKINVGQNQLLTTTVTQNVKKAIKMKHAKINGPNRAKNKIKN